MKKRILVGLALIVIAFIVAGGVYFYNLTAPVEVSNSAPVAPTLNASVATPSGLTNTTSPATTTVSANSAASQTASTVGSTVASQVTSTTSATGQAQVYRIAAAKSKATYNVKEVLAGNSQTAVGATSAIAGDILVDTNQPDNSKVGEIVIDISQFTSDNSQRDNALRRQWLESSKYPTATLKNATLSGLPAIFSKDTEFSFKVTGDLTVHGTTKPVTFDAKATLKDDGLYVTATTGFKMSSFNISPPEMTGFLKAEDDVVLKLDLVATVVGNS